MSVNCFSLISILWALTQFKHKYEPDECTPDALSRSSVETLSPGAPHPQQGRARGPRRSGHVGPYIPWVAVPADESPDF